MPSRRYHGERQRVACGCCLHITQRAQHTFGVSPVTAFRINIPAAGFKTRADIRLEITPRIE